MPRPVRCAFCAAMASRFFVTLDNTLWSACDHDARPFLGFAVELDPEKYDLEAYFSRLYEEEPR
jgi:hypothetical protein